MKIDELFQHASQSWSDIHEHLPRMRQIGESCQHITEFGVRNGVSTIAWIAARPQRLICYDIHRYAEVEELERVAEEAGVDFTFRVKDVLSLSIEATDLLFIDTLHTYDQLRMELARHAGHVRKYLVLHDTEAFAAAGEVPGTRGLWQAIEEFLAANDSWRLFEKHTNNNGLTVLARRSVT